MRVTRIGEVASPSPSVACRIVEFRADQRRADVATGDENLAVRQQSRAMQFSTFDEFAGGGPGAACRIVELCARQESGAIEVTTGCHKYFTVRQQGRGMIQPPGRQTPGRRPPPGCRVIEFRAGEIAVVISTSDKYLPIGQQGGGV